MEEKELTLKEIQQGSFEVLKKIKEICDNNNFRYYLMYGTLIGAVRHKGFVPWDDDIDVMMPRCDYKKFIEYCIKNSEKLKPFELMHYKTNKKYIYPIARMSDSRYRIEDSCRDYGLGLFVDIYPYDGINENDYKHIKKICNIERIIGTAIGTKFKKSKSFKKNIGKFLAFLITRITGARFFLKKIDVTAQKYNYDNSDYVTCVCWEVKSIKCINKKMIDEDIKELIFNGINFRVPYDYDGVLRAHYNDYMKLPPENERVGHHFYKAYKK